MLGSLLLPPAGAGQGLEAGDPAGVQEACQADLSCAELGEEAAVWLREAGVQAEGRLLVRHVFRLPSSSRVWVGSAAGRWWATF